MDPSTDNEKKYFFDNPKNIQRVLYGLYASCVLLFLLDFVIHRHTLHDLEKIWGFYSIYGFVGCVILVLVAKWMRTFLMRPEDYYDKQELSHPTSEQATPASETNSAHPDSKGDNNVDA